jgi:hypothetical protein
LNTDLNTLQSWPNGLIEVLNGNPEVPALKQVAIVKGVIDRAFELLLQRRLDQYPDAKFSDDLANGLAKMPLSSPSSTISE